MRAGGEGLREHRASGQRAQHRAERLSGGRRLFQRIRQRAGQDDRLAVAIQAGEDRQVRARSADAGLHAQHHRRHRMRRVQLA